MARRRTVASQCYRFSLFCLVLLVSITLLAALYDILQQVVNRAQDTKATQAADFIISAGTYVFIGIAAVIIVFSRLLTVRRQLAAIPRAYVPINVGEVPKAVSTMVALEYSRCAVISNMCKPKDRILQGCGKPGTPLEGCNLRVKILETYAIMDLHLQPHIDDLTQVDKSLTPLPDWISPHASPLQRFLPLLLPQGPLKTSVIPAILLPMVQLLDKIVTKARYDQQEPSQEETENCLKICAKLLGAVSKHGRTLSPAVNKAVQ